MKEKEMKQIAFWIKEVLLEKKDQKKIKRVFSAISAGSAREKGFYVFNLRHLRALKCT